MKALKYGLLAVALFLTVGCGQGGFSKKVQAGKENTFRYPIVTSPTTLDCGIVQDGDTIDLLQQVYEGLVTWNEQNEVAPLLAESWEIEDGGKRYVFHLRKGVKFHNGREVTADDFKWTYERNTDPKLKSPTWQYLADIVGVRDKWEGRAKEVSGIQVRDPYTLVIQIDKPRPYFLGKLTYLINAVLPKESVPATEEITDISQMVGTGPFKPVRYERDQIFILEANKDYHGGAPLVDRIERQIIKDPAARLSKFKAGELDLVMLERQDVPALKEDPKFAPMLKFFDRPSIYYIGMNQNAYRPFKNRDVRRAFAMVVDKDKIVNDVLGGLNVVANSIVPPGVLGHRANAAAIPYDPAGARQLLAKAGYPNGKGLPPLEMRFREDRPDIKLVAEAVASQLRRDLGVEVQLRSMEWRAYLEAWNKSEIGFFHMRWAADYLDPENFLSYMLSTTGPENKIGYSNPEFDRLCAVADGTMDTEARLRMYAEAEDIVLQDAPWVPIYFQRDFELISPRVSGLRESLFGHLPHTKVRLSP
jgi:ABC-type transport system substrate-binding protein